MTRDHAAGSARDSMTRTPNKFPSPTRGPAAADRAQRLPGQELDPAAAHAATPAGPPALPAASVSARAATHSAMAGTVHGGTVTGVPDPTVKSPWRLELGKWDLSVSAPRASRPSSVRVSSATLTEPIRTTDIVSFRTGSRGGQGRARAKSLRLLYVSKLLAILNHTPIHAENHLLILTQNFPVITAGLVNDMSRTPEFRTESKSWSQWNGGKKSWFGL